MLIQAITTKVTSKFWHVKNLAAYLGQNKLDLLVPRPFSGERVNTYLEIALQHDI